MDRTIIIRFDARTLVLAGAVLIMVAAWLPWTSMPTFVVGELARSGLPAGGLLTFALAVLAGLSLLLPWRPWSRVSMPAAILAALINLIALAAFARIIQYAALLELDLTAHLSSVGSGLYVTFAGAWLMLFGGLSDGAPAGLLTFNHGWIGYTAWGGLIVVVLTACLCAWSIGLMMRPYTLDTGQQAAATFGPAPTAFLVTPLVGVQLAPLGGANANPVNPPTATLVAGARLGATSTLPPLPTASPQAGTSAPATRTPTPATSATRSLTITPSATASPIRSTATTPLATTPLATTPVPTTGTGTRASGNTPVFTGTPTGSPTPTPFTSSVATPTPSTSPVGTPTTP